MKTITLNFEQKKQLRELYGRYKSIKRKDYETREETIQARMEVKQEYTDSFSELKAAEISINDLPEYIYSKNQLLFIEDCEEQGLDVDFSYSGRGMFGNCCPAVRVYSHNDIKTKADTTMDSMGKGLVVYCEN